LDGAQAGGALLRPCSNCEEDVDMSQHSADYIQPTDARMEVEFLCRQCAEREEEAAGKQESFIITTNGASPAQPLIIITEE
jgi:hypothetical protein